MNQLSNNKKLGAALIAFNQTHEFTSKEIYFGELAANQISLAILKSQLLD